MFSENTQMTKSAERLADHFRNMCLVMITHECTAANKCHDQNKRTSQHALPTRQ